MFEAYARSVHRLGTPVFPKKYFAMLQEVFGDECEVRTIVTEDNRLVAAVLSFYWRDEVVPYYGGGMDLAREVRTHSDVPIIMLTGRDDVTDRVVGLEVGADDYIAKPFHLREVLARVRSVLRRHRPATHGREASPGELVEFDGWRLDLGRRQLLSPAGVEVVLTTGEFDMLVVLIRHPGRVMTREVLMDLTRGRGRDAFDRTIDAQIARLRKKVESGGGEPHLVKSIRGVGYVFTGRVGSTSAT